MVILGTAPKARSAPQQPNLAENDVTGPLSCQHERWPGKEDSGNAGKEDLWGQCGCFLHRFNELSVLLHSRT